MPSLLELVALAGGAGFFGSKIGAKASSSTPGSSLLDSVLSTGPTAPHLKPGARLLSDAEIIAQIDTVHGAIHGGNIKAAVATVLPTESLNAEFHQSGCQGQPPPHAILTTAEGGGLALKVVGSTGLVAGGLLGPLTFGLSAVIGVFATIFAHHAQAVAREQKVLCASVPTADASLAAIEDAVMSGRVKPAQGQQLLAQLFAEFDATVAPIRKMNNSQCNAACVWTRCLQAIVIKKQNRYAQLV